MGFAWGYHFPTLYEQDLHPIHAIMKLSTSSSVACASALACFTTLSAAAATPTTNDPPSRVLDTRDPPGETLVGDYTWIRSVEEPYLHYYLQTDPQLVAASAIMGDPSTAAQWAIQDEQLVELVDTDGTVLYAHVAQPETEDARTLNVSLAAEPNTFGAFSWSGKMQRG